MNTHHPLRQRLGLDERLLLWLALLAGGYAWVAMVQCHRPAPFIGRAGDYTHFIRLMVMALPLYLAGPRLVLRSWSEEGVAALWKNAVLYVLPFFIGLQFFYLQRIDAINYSLNYHDLSTMGATGIVVFSAAAGLIAGLAIFHVMLARQARILVSYAATFIGAILAIVFVSYLVRETRYVHIHHWFLFAFFVPFARFRHPISTVAQAVCAAIMVEGVAEWTMSTIWELR